MRPLGKSRQLRLQNPSSSGPRLTPELPPSWPNPVTYPPPRVIPPTEDGSCHARSVPTGSQRGPVKSLQQTKPLLSAHSGKKLSFYILTSPPTLSPWLALLSHTGSFSLFLKHLRQVPPQGLWACRSLVLECSSATCPQLPPSLPLGLSHTSITS